MTRTQLKASLKLWTRRAVAARKDWHAAKASEKRRTTKASKARAHVDRVKAYGKLVAAKAITARRRRQLAASTPVRERAYNEASALVGIMESGGNNRGEGVEKIIREGGGLAGQAWCGWFCSAVYKRAGSKAPTWQWGAVRLMDSSANLAQTSSPRRGDLARFTFDHVGMFVKDNGDGTITTIEGNTGATGAVSDGNGSDGVYRKIRSKSLVRDYRRATK